MATAETCHNCVYAKWDLALWARTLPGGFPARPVCANHPDCLGRIKECPLGRICRNFRPKPPVPKGETVRTIPLGDGFYAYVDAADYEWLSQWTWRLHDGYAIRYEKGERICMHNEILPPPKGKRVDHKNLNRRDNTRENLRHATHAENMRNKSKKPDASSRFRGVIYRKDSGKWQARIWLHGRNISLGMFDSEVEAARAYDRAAVEYYGEFARLNFPEEWPDRRRKALATERSKGPSAEAMHASPVHGKGRRAKAVSNEGKTGGRPRPRATEHGSRGTIANGRSKKNR